MTLAIKSMSICGVQIFVRFCVIISLLDTHASGLCFGSDMERLETGPFMSFN